MADTKNHRLIVFTSAQQRYETNIETFTFNDGRLYFTLVGGKQFCTTLPYVLEMDVDPGASSLFRK